MAVISEPYKRLNILIIDVYKRQAQKRGQGDAATLQSANSHADAAVASEKSARESGDRLILYICVQRQLTQGMTVGGLKG